MTMIFLLISSEFVLLLEFFSNKINVDYKIVSRREICIRWKRPKIIIDEKDQRLSYASLIQE